jgi:hypothetical protein
MKSDGRAVALARYNKRGALSKTDVAKAVGKFMRDYSRRPTLTDFRKTNSYASSQTILRKFGGIDAAIVAAGGQYA